ncbi:1502_t:CDS:2 [Cetraspora pellucida]|uniref:1502_t:CDS:1 n=1 Tax=Cetraspora pellucida TaxID=1433469 RepID=A0A9N9NCE7_9GLOM|nr:1502_t:CDS:2 [Cetraspora pellucida]
MKICLYIYASVVTFFWITTRLVNCQAALRGQWDFVGYSGVSCMHCILSTNTNKAIFIERVELSTDVEKDGKPTYSVEYDLDTNEIRPLTTLSNTFCSAGSYLPNGTIVNLAGAEAGKGFSEGFNRIRLFNPCDDKTCDWQNDVYNLTENRWYPTVEMLADGTLFIIGGSSKGAGVNNATINVPSFEIYPSAPGAKPIPFQFLVDTLPNNLYPLVHLLTNGNLFILANQKAIVYDVTSQQIKINLPDVPRAARNYPLTGASVLLPLDSSNKSEVLVCGGGNKISSTQTVGEISCARISPMSSNPSWEIEEMPFGRLMPDPTILADGTVLILNGCYEGTAGFGKGKNPVLTPVLYNPKAQAGSRFTIMQPSYIPRMYHSVAMTMPSGQVLVTGSNPNRTPMFTGPYPTEFRVETFSPPYLFSSVPQPKIQQAPKNLKYGQSFEIEYVAYSGTRKITANFLNPGFVTHSIHMSQRLVWLDIIKLEDNKLSVMAPAGSTLAPPAPYLLHIVDNGIPSKAVWVSLSS